MSRPFKKSWIILGDWTSSLAMLEDTLRGT
ncbi:unnamed protein product, partial [Allacma fusca]